jgi:ubiquinone/menaquinone biosynthesis C-methylase UbiE
MSSNRSQPPGSYALGHSEKEVDRLSRQAEAFGPFTRQVFEQAGIKPGMRVLDIGCGGGDVAFLAAELVGPTGEVVGVGRAPEAVARATLRAKNRNMRNLHFVEGDPTPMEFEHPFDASSAAWS